MLEVSHYGRTEAWGEPHAKAEEEDDEGDVAVSLIAPDGPVPPCRASGSWAPGLASVLFLRHSAQAAPQARSRLLRDLVTAGPAPSATTRCEVSRREAASLFVPLLAMGLLVLLLRWPAAEQHGASPKHATELALECTRVACVGASITKGNVIVYGGELASDAPYPQQLQRMLGPGYCVENFGVPDATVLKESRFPFWTRPQLKQVSDFQPDIVVIQFGANDSKEPNFERDFRKDYASMIKHFRNLLSRPQVYIMAMPPIYPGTASKDGIPGKKYGMNRDRVDNLRVPLNLISQENGLSLPISVLNSFKKHCPDMSAKCSWMSGDGVHPNHEGDEAMARLVHLTISGDDFCNMPSSDKERCGDPGNTSEATCKDMGCCYRPDSEGAPWCFHKQNAARPQPEECLASRDEKTDCGFQGDDSHQCEARGCCYRPTLDGTPWCFHRLQPRSPSVRPGDEFVREITTTTRTATVTGTSTTTSVTSTRTSTSTRTTSTSTVTTGEGGSLPQASGWLLWLGVGFLMLLPLPCALRPWRRREDMTLEGSPELDTRQHQEDEEQRQLRRLAVDKAMRSAERKRVESERRRSLRITQTMLSDAGFTGINEPKKKRLLFRTHVTYPLHAAVEANNVEAIKLLLQAEADANLVDSKKRTPLALAEQLNKKDSHMACISALTSSGLI